VDTNNQIFQALLERMKVCSMDAGEAVGFVKAAKAAENELAGESSASDLQQGKESFAERLQRVFLGGCRNKKLARLLVDSLLTIPAGGLRGVTIDGAIKIDQLLSKSKDDDDEVTTSRLTEQLQKLINESFLFSVPPNL